MSAESVVDMGLSPEQQADLIHEFTTRAVDQIYPTAEALTEELYSGRRLTAYMGIDPTATDIHIGHESQLLKLERLQKLGHNVILLIGDFTAMIGDPSDKSASRVRLSREEVLENAETYKQQASKVLDFEHPTNPVQLRYNSTWLGEMGFGDVLELASEFTVQQMLERETFRKRIEEGKPVSLQEFLYPIMQGYDSVAMDVDIEIGGSDQIFNMLTGSTLIKRHKAKQKFIVTGQLLADPTGKKIGKTEGNMIAMNDTPLDMFHRIMMWGDDITPHALELCTNMPMDDVAEIGRQLKSGELSGIDGKILLARTIVSDLHDSESADNAYGEYMALTSKAGDFDIDMLTAAPVQTGDNIVDILCSSGLAKSKSEARRLLAGNAVRVNGETVTEDWQASPSEQETVLQVGKKKLENHRRLIYAEGE